MSNISFIPNFFVYYRFELLGPTEFKIWGLIEVTHERFDVYLTRIRRGDTTFTPLTGLYDREYWLCIELSKLK
jgi:hypothetical protein